MSVYHNANWTNTVHYNGMMTHEPKFTICKSRTGKEKEVVDFYLSQNYGKIARLLVHCVSFNIEGIEILKKQTKMCVVNVTGLLDRDLASKNLRILVQNLEIGFVGDNDLLKRKGKLKKNGNENDSNGNVAR